MIKTIGWCLPRPAKSKYIGAFPLHFESKLFKELGLDPTKIKILHPFGGKAIYGIRCDIKSEVNPDVICDAHNLPFEDESFDVVILDPPYSEDYSKRLYQTDKIKLKFGKYTKEAVRVCKEDGYVVMFHEKACPTIPGTLLVLRVLIETRVWHKARIVHVHKKTQEYYKKELK